MSSRTRNLASLLLLGLGLAVAGCGYSSGVRLPPGVETVGVEYFGNDSPEPDLERELYARLSAQVDAMVRGELAPPDAADLVIRGRILDYRRLLGLTGVQGSLVESAVIIVVQAWLFDRRLGTTVGEMTEISREVRYVVHVRAGERGARELAMANLSQELVLDLFSQMDYEPAGAEPVPVPPGDRLDEEGE